MGQALWCYDCCWFAECKCVGISWGLMCCNCWVCQPEDIAFFRNGSCCVTEGCSNGCGGTLCICGSYCCAPEWLQLYSIRTTIGDKRPVFKDIQIVNIGGGGTAQNMYAQ